MLYAVISDIHSNIEAFEAVLEDIRKHNIPNERVLCLGDIVGYGPSPIECIDEAMKLRITICGNHDWAVIHEPIGFNRVAREAIAWTKQILKPRWYSLSGIARRRYNFLANLPETWEFGEISLVHGSPRRPIEEYVLRSDFDEILKEMTGKMRENFSKTKWLAFCGHSHIPLVLTDEPSYLDPRNYVEEPLALKRERKYIVNVGSVGQPRDHETRSCYVLFDDEKLTIQYRRVKYDTEKTAAAIRAIKELDEALAERLLLGV
ncbi:MAG: metallophosphatase family protein [Planctomycetota bacterium]|nr:metallophosphatase family protein [Planctomycetota bacterium]